MSSMTKRQERSGRKGLPEKSMKVKLKRNEKSHGRPKPEKAEEYRKGSNRSPEIKGSEKIETLRK